MFIDHLTTTLVAGSGGDGAIAWRREKFIPKGGPAGGDGGDGGSIIIQATPNLYSLDHLRNKRLIKAKNGIPGGGSNKTGKSAENLTLTVPLGTLIKDSETHEVLFDFTANNQTFVICQGGRGGKGNSRFATPSNRAPLQFTKGTQGETKGIELELKLIADIGLVGMPNAGKSTLISALSKIRVKIAPYPFTTLKPNLGLIEFDDYSRLLIADIPGIINNAHQNKGLGLEFLKHVERTSLLLFVVDISGFEGRNPIDDFLLLQKELKAYNPSLLEKPFLVALNQIDRLTDSDNIELFKQAYPYNKNTLFPISALEKEGLSALLEKMRVLSQAKGKRYI